MLAKSILVGSGGWRLSYDVKIGAGGVEFVLAFRNTWIRALTTANGGSLLLIERAPVPNPVQGVGTLTLREILGHRNIRCTPELFALATGLARLVVWGLLLTLCRDRCARDLVAAAVIVILRRNENARLVTALAIGCPLHDIHDLGVVFWLLGAEDEDGAARELLALLSERIGDVTVLEILHGDCGAGSDLKTGILGCVGLCALAGVADGVGVVNASALGFCRRQHPHHRIAVEAGIGTGNVASGISVGDVFALTVDEGELLVP